MWMILEARAGGGVALGWPGLPSLSPRRLRRVRPRKWTFLILVFCMILTLQSMLALVTGSVVMTPLLWRRSCWITDGVLGLFLSPFFWRWGFYLSSRRLLYGPVLIPYEIQCFTFFSSSIRLPIFCPCYNVLGVRSRQLRYRSRRCPVFREYFVWMWLGMVGFFSLYQAAILYPFFIISSCFLPIGLRPVPRRSVLSYLEQKSSILTIY